MKVVIDHPGDWICGRYPKDEDQIIGLTFWQPES